MLAVRSGPEGVLGQLRMNTEPKKKLLYSLADSRVHRLVFRVEGPAECEKSVTNNSEIERNYPASSHAIFLRVMSERSVGNF